MLKSIFIFLLFSSFFGAILWNLKTLTFIVKTHWKFILTIGLSACAAFIITFI